MCPCPLSPDGLSAPSAPYGVPLVTVELERINTPPLPAVSPGGAPRGGGSGTPVPAGLFCCQRHTQGHASSKIPTPGSSPRFPMMMQVFLSSDACLQTSACLHPGCPGRGSSTGWTCPTASFPPDVACGSPGIWVPCLLSPLAAQPASAHLGPSGRLRSMCAHELKASLWPSALQGLQIHLPHTCLNPESELVLSQGVLSQS